MSTCHQAHNIPWNTFLELLHKVPPRYPPSYPAAPEDVLQELVFTPDEEGNVSRKIIFFAKKFQATIKEFSLTERKKYLDKDIDSMTQVYDKEVCNDYLREDLQELSTWSALKEGSQKSYYDMPYLEAVKELFIQEQIAPLLHLARSGICLEKLQFVTYSNFFHYGIGRIKEDCLTLYIHLNLLLATGTICDPNRWYAQWKTFLQREILICYDGNAHARMFKEYFVNNPKFEDLEGLQDLLKKLFRMLYVYDMVLNERNRNIDWKDEILSCVGYFVDRTNRKNHSFWYKQIDDERMSANLI